MAVTGIYRDGHQPSQAEAVACPDCTWRGRLAEAIQPLCDIARCPYCDAAITAMPSEQDNEIPF